MLINKLDNVEISPDTGHKHARVPIRAGEAVIKYGEVIGRATADIAVGEHVHTHNLKTALEGKLEYTYEPFEPIVKPAECDAYFDGYVRENGDVGIRNDIWIIPTVGCVNKTAERLSRLTGAKCFTHPYGCSQLGDDQLTTQKILSAMVKHPNAGGVLVLGLGCENNNIGVFKTFLGEYNPERVKFLVAQEHEDEIAVGVALIDELKAYARRARREKIPASRLIVGLKCGGSDAFSGISANPLVGRFCDKLCSMGGACVLTEVPEMFGAEHLLMKRCASREVFDKTVSLINDFKDYYTRHNQVIYENPSPGNKAGGITTLEEKSLGCIQKGGSSTIVDVLNYGERVTKSGLSLLNGVGNDMVAVTNLMASGAHLILFTTGRGTPLGSAVPTIKISTNRALFDKKLSWIDFDSSLTLDGVELRDELFEHVLWVASGGYTQNEKNGYEEIAIFKDGVTL